MRLLQIFIVAIFDSKLNNYLSTNYSRPKLIHFRTRLYGLLQLRVGKNEQWKISHAIRNYLNSRTYIKLSRLPENS